MSLNTMTASLHAGLIHRRRRRPSDETAKVVTMLAPRSNGGNDILVAASAADRVPEAGHATKRFGLTVRVEDDLRSRLFLHRARTGKTTQAVLHRALTDFLDRQGES
ncbi:MAG: hypothetical protein AAF334_03190 [Pseudomonadota bacterium]